MGTRTWTLARRELSRRVKEPFFRQFGNFGTVDGLLGSTAFWDDALAKFGTNPGWTKATAYFPTGQAGGQEGEITNFVVPASGVAGYAYVTPQLSPNAAANDTYEFHSRFRVSEKLDAVNTAIRDAWPEFYKFNTDTSIIIQKWKRVYDLTSISPQIKNISRVYIEPMWLFASGKATGGSNTTNNWNLRDTTQTLALDATKTYEVAIYYGTGAGQVRTVNIAGSFNPAYTPSLGPTFDDTHNLVVTAAWTTTPDSTSQYVVKNTLDVDKPWIGPQVRIRLDTDDNPTVLETLDGLTGYWGARIKIEYYSLVAEMANEASTIEDQAWGYVLPRTLYHLFMANITSGPQKEVDTAKLIAAQYEAEAELARKRNAYPPLKSTVHGEQRFQIGIDRERPFNSN